MLNTHLDILKNWDQLESIGDKQKVLLRPWIRDHLLRFGSDALNIHDVGEQIAAGMPIQYVLGWSPFMQFILQVTPDVLIPRPETEELVRMIIQYYPKEYSGTFMDIGTGSGAIAIALSKYFKRAKVIATDISINALDVAYKNVEELEANIHFIENDFLNENRDLPSADVIVSNPPYIDPKEREKVDDHVHLYEPQMALYGPRENPLIFYKRMSEYLRTGQECWLELNALQVDKIKTYYTEKKHSVTIHKDMQGLDRVLHAGWQNPS